MIDGRNKLIALFRKKRDAATYRATFQWTFKVNSFLFILYELIVICRYVSEMLLWIQSALTAEREILVSAVLKGCQPELINSLSKSVLSNISEALCQPLRVGNFCYDSVCFAICFTSGPSWANYHKGIKLCCSLSSIFSFYLLCQKFWVSQTFSLYRIQKDIRAEMDAQSVLVKALFDLHELSQHMFFSVVNATIQRITTKVFELNIEVITMALIDGKSRL